MMACRGASFLTKSSIFSEMSKMMTMPMMSISDTKKVIINLLKMYQSSFFIIRVW